MMNPGGITTRQADAIVELLASLRPDWDKAGIRAACRKAADISDSPSRVAVAAVFAATTASNLTPAVIGMRGEHWKALDPNRGNEPPRPRTRCDVCHGLHDPAAAHDPKPSPAVSDYAQQLRTQVRKTWRPTP